MSTLPFHGMLTKQACQHVMHHLKSFRSYFDDICASPDAYATMKSKKVLMPFTTELNLSLKQVI